MLVYLWLGSGDFDQHFRDETNAQERRVSLCPLPLFCWRCGEVDASSSKRCTNATDDKNAIHRTIPFARKQTRFLGTLKPDSLPLPEAASYGLAREEPTRLAHHRLWSAASSFSA